MVDYIILYRGETIDNARYVGASADPELVKEFAAKLLDTQTYDPEETPDPILRALNQGRQNALQLIVKGKAVAR